LILADTGNNRIRVVAERSGTYFGRQMRAGDIYTVAGNDNVGFSGDGVPGTPRCTRHGRYLLYDQLGHGHRAVGSGLSGVGGLAVEGAGNVIVTTGYQVWVAAESTGQFFGHAMRAGHLYHLAGLRVDAHTQFPVRGSGGDGAAASRAQFSGLKGVAVDQAGNVVVADQTRIRVIAASSGTCYGQQMTQGDIYTIAGVVYRP
jgi:hypothetical protein